MFRLCDVKVITKTIGGKINGIKKFGIFNAKIDKQMQFEMFYVWSGVFKIKKQF